jgi:cation transport regulator ChaC
VGLTGANRDYLLNTQAQLRALGVRDAGLDRIAALLPPPVVNSVHNSDDVVQAASG